MPKFIDLTGQTINGIIVIEQAPKRCGNVSVFVVKYSLRNGDTKSCGCLKNSYGEFRISKILTDNNIKFEKTQEHDKIKNEYCKQHNIPLIRIPFTEINNLNINMLKPETSIYLLD